MTQGHHGAARVYLALGGNLGEQLDALGLPTPPTREEVATARALLIDHLFCDFPFVDESSKAHAIALTLLPFVRQMIEGPTPNHAVVAPGGGEGTGKGLLVQVACAPGLGEIAVIPETRNDDELRKLLLAILIEGSPIALLDNRKHELNSGVLAAALTARHWQDRILGRSKTARPTVLTTWVITGNALRVSGEIARRTVWIRLNANMPQPWKRTSFRNELPGWAYEHRAELIRACIIVVQNWLALGRPNGVRTMGSYERWACVMGGILDAAGISGFLTEAAESATDHSNDEDANRWNLFIDSWWQKRHVAPMIPKDLLELATELVPETEKTTKRSRATRLGNLLTRNVGRIFAVGSLNRAYLKIVREKVERNAGGPHRGFALCVVPKTGTGVGGVGRTSDSAEIPSETKENFPANFDEDESISSGLVGGAEVADFKGEPRIPPTRPTSGPDHPQLKKGVTEIMERDGDVEEIEEEI